MIISRISKRNCTGLFPRCRYVQRHNKNTNLKLEIRFKGVGILLTLGILEHSPLMYTCTYMSMHICTHVFVYICSFIHSFKHV